MCNSNTFLLDGIHCFSIMFYMWTRTGTTRCRLFGLDAGEKTGSGIIARHIFRHQPANQTTLSISASPVNPLRPKQLISNTCDEPQTPFATGLLSPASRLCRGSKQKRYGENTDTAARLRCQQNTARKDKNTAKSADMGRAGAVRVAAALRKGPIPSLQHTSGTSGVAMMMSAAPSFFKVRGCPSPLARSCPAFLSRQSQFLFHSTRKYSSASKMASATSFYDFKPLDSKLPLARTKATPPDRRCDSDSDS